MSISVSESRAPGLDRLPAPAAAKARRLRDAAEDAHASYRALSDRREHHRAVVSDAERERDRFEAALRTGRATRRIPEKRGSALMAERVEPDDAGLERARAAAEQAKAELAHHDARMKAASDRQKALRGVVTAIDKFLSERRGPLAGFDGPVPKVPKGDPVSEAEKLRARRAELVAERDRIEKAPLTIEEARQAARRHVEALVERGRPDVSPTIERGFPPHWPTSSIALGLVSAEVSHGFASGSVTDAVALLAWLDPEAMIARLEAEIYATADPDAGLSPEDRRTRRAEIEAEILTLERQEEAVIEAAEGRGVEILRRPDADPRAVLGLADGVRRKEAA